MKTYDFKKAKQLIEENKENLLCASLGMHEDWFWTAEPIWEGGAFKRELPDNSDEVFGEFKAKLKEGVSLFSDEMIKYRDSILIGGIYGSSWATPTLQLQFKDDTEKMIPCHNGGKSDGTAPIELLGVLSTPVQENITPLSKN